MNKWFLLTILLGRIYTSVSQDIHYSGVFPTIDHSGILSEKWSYNSYNFAAIKPYGSTSDKARTLYVYFENGVSYHLTPYLSITNAYVYERQETFEKNARNEHRIFQQITYQSPLTNKWGIKLRARFDERFIQDVVSKEYDFYHRLRALVGLEYILSKKIYVFGYSEYFFDTTKNSRFKFNENWSALQFGYRFNEKNSIEFGYLYVGWIRNALNNWLHQHYLQLTWVNRLNLAKK